ncbi:MAG TPA: carbohydrate ABC transporter permease [Deinococcales bacterium]|nr:carbohydrate ABC transporter permease [Deinococcales bacterium]
MTTATQSAPAGSRTRLRSPFQRWLVQDAPRFLLLIILAIIFLAPMYWMLVTSFKPEADAITIPVQWWPKRFTFENYQEILTSPDGNILRWTLNSVIAAVAFTAAHLALCILTAYPLARMRFKGRDAWFWIILSSMMVPGIVTLIPTYLMMLNWSWTDTFHALIWPGVSGVFGVFLLRQFFVTIPPELEEAARMDGANSLQVLRHVVLPLSKASLITLGVFDFMGSWNNYVWPLFTEHGDMQTLPVGLASFSQRYVTDYGKLMAATALAAIPVLVIYLIAQRYLEQGIALTGMKE